MPGEKVNKKEKIKKRLWRVAQSVIIKILSTVPTGGNLFTNFAPVFRGADGGLVMRKMKKFLSLTLAVVMTLALGMSVFAAQEPSAAATEYPNLTNYNTDYSKTFDAAAGGTWTLMVQQANAEYEPALFETRAAANRINWTVLGDASGVTVKKEQPESVDGLYAAKATVTVAAGAAAGPVVIEATNASGAYMDFTAVVNGSVASQADVPVKVYIGAATDNNMKVIDLTKTINADAHKDTVDYPTVMDTIPAVAVEGAYEFQTQWGSEVLYTLFTHTNGGNNGWQYRVYNTATGDMIDLSQKVGAGVYRVNAGETVVWAYGDYSTTLFPANLNAN